MAKLVGDIFLNQKLLWENVFKRSQEYQNIEIDFFDTIYLYLLRNILDYRQYETGFICPYPQIEITNETEMFIIEAISILFRELEPALRKKDFYVYSKKTYNLKELSKREDMVGILASLDLSVKSDSIRLLLQKLVNFFYETTTSEFLLRKEIPATWATEMTKELHGVFQRHGKILKNRELSQYIQKYHFVSSNKNKVSIPLLPNYIKLLPTSCGQMYIFVDGVCFGKENWEFFDRLTNSNTIQLLCAGVFFNHCNFEMDFVAQDSWTDTRLYFKDCSFNGVFYKGYKNHRAITYENCYFKKGIDLIQNTYYTSLYFYSCHFLKNSTFLIDSCTFKKAAPGHLEIKDCSFQGPFILKNSSILSSFKMENIAFFNRFEFSDLKINEEQFSLENFSFNNTKDIDDCKEKLLIFLEKLGKKNMAQNLGLSSKNNKKSGKIDMDAYQAAYATGYLNPDYAAFLLGRSTSYLAKKRANDRQRIVRDSLPFIVSGRDVQYPVEALLALKSQNWATLKELRQRYPIPKD